MNEYTNGYDIACNLIYSSEQCPQCRAKDLSKECTARSATYYQGMLFACHMVLELPHQCEDKTLNLSEGDMNAFLMGKPLKFPAMVNQWT